MENTMIDRLLPIFALIGFLSSIAYISLAAWLVYTKVLKQKKKLIRTAPRQLHSH